MRSETFRARVAAQPENLLFRFSLGQALFQEGAFAEAMTHLEHCAAGRSDWLIPRLLLGQACLHLQQKEDGRRWLEEALALAITQNHDDPAAECRQLLAELANNSSLAAE